MDIQDAPPPPPSQSANAGNNLRSKKSSKRSRSENSNPAHGLKLLTWKEIGPSAASNSVVTNVPVERSGHRIVTDGANVLSFGGYYEHTNGGEALPFFLENPNLQKTLFNELWSLSLTDNTWTLLPTTGNPPTELASFSAFLCGNYYIVFGGTGIPFGETQSNRIHVCDLRTLTWRLLECTGDAPPPQYGQGVYVDADYFYTVGGTTGFIYSIDVHRLHLKTLVWEALYTSSGAGDPLDEPEARYRHELASDGTFLYVFGGGTANAAFALDKIPAFHIENRKWYTANTWSASGYPGRRKGLGLAQLGNDVYICGGFEAMHGRRDLWKINLKDREWIKIHGRMPAHLFFHGCTITKEGCLCVFGGVSNMLENQRTNRVYSIWVKVPSLKELAWDSLMSKYSKIAGFNSDTLLALGIPQDYIDRVAKRKAKVVEEPSIESRIKNLPVMDFD